MDVPWCPSRRRLLAIPVNVLAVPVIAGCAERGNEGQSATESRDAAGGTTARDRDTATATQGDTPRPEATAPEGTPGSADADTLDLREANVVGVSFRARNGTYTFDVTLHHDDDGEAGYANWWQIERLDGRRLGRRELLHAHSQQPFTRSATVEIPAGVTCVVVRGHDQTHEYGGRVMLTNLESGATRSIDQGPEPRSFAATDCP